MCARGKSSELCCTPLHYYPRYFVQSVEQGNKEGRGTTGGWEPRGHGERAPLPSPRQPAACPSAPRFTFTTAYTMCRATWRSMQYVHGNNFCRMYKWLCKLTDIIKILRTVTYGGQEPAYPKPQALCSLLSKWARSNPSSSTSTLHAVMPEEPAECPARPWFITHQLLFYHSSNFTRLVSSCYKWEDLSSEGYLVTQPIQDGLEAAGQGSERQRSISRLWPSLLFSSENCTSVSLS